ncbi:hypothetical protein F240042I4_57240 [Eisenbergiella tayi]
MIKLDSSEMMRISGNPGVMVIMIEGMRSAGEAQMGVVYEKKNRIVDVYGYVCGNAAGLWKPGKGKQRFGTGGIPGGI